MRGSRFIWTAEHDMTAASMRWNGATNAEIGQRFGVSARIVSNRFSYLGKRRSVDVVERRKVLKVKESSADTEAMIKTEREQQIEAAARHAEVLMAHGGFCAFSEKPLGSGKWAVCLPLIWPARAS